MTGHPYFAALAAVLRDSSASLADGTACPQDRALTLVIERLEALRAAGTAKLMFVGNGGSAGIASHMAIDYTKNGGYPALAFSDAAALTCLANDLGYAEAFAYQVAVHGRPGDLLVAISSSGRSANILNAVAAARTRGCGVVTLSGFAGDNPLRSAGDINFYVPSDQYGFVEIAHLALLHAILDLAMGWDGRTLGQGPLAPRLLAWPAPDRSPSLSPSVPQTVKS